ncbi:MAG TPA: hypothetical protein VIQ29_08880 [Ancylobacter sp.]
MAFSNPSPQPGIGAVKQAALKAAWSQVVRAFPGPATAGSAGTSLEEALIRAIEQAFSNGERDLHELTNAALSVVPKLSRPRSLRR